MPKVYVRTQPKSQLKKRHRAGMGFSDVWKEVEVDDATLAALNEDPYLEVSDTPTVLVEVAATIQPAAVDAIGDPINPKSEKAEDLTQADGVQSAAGAESGESSKGDDQSAVDPVVDVVEETVVDPVVDVVEETVVDPVVDPVEETIVDPVVEQPAKTGKKAK